MIAGQVVDLLPAMPFEHLELTHDLLPFGVLWRALRAGDVAQVQRNVPSETRRTL